MKYVNEPRRRTRAFYAQCQDEFVALAQAEPGIQAVYAAGSIRNLGVSDLDFVICLNDEAKGVATLEQRLTPGLTTMLAGGTIIKLPETHFSRVKIIDDLPLRHLWGKEYAFKEYATSHVELCRVLDWLPERADALRTWMQTNPRDVWRGLLLLKSMTVSLAKLDALLGRTEFAGFTQAITTWRGEWFSRDSKKDLEKYMGEAVYWGEKALQRVAKHVEQQEYFQIEPDRLAWPRTLSIPGGPEFVFGGKSSRRRPGLPKNLYYFFAAQALLARGVISDQLREILDLPSDFPIADIVKPELAQVIRQRMEYCNEVAAFLRSQGISRGLLKYGWLL